MSTCCQHCIDGQALFDEKRARKELKRYKKKGPIKSTRFLIDQLQEEGVEGKELLDVGGGVGAIQHELFGSGLGNALNVDAAPAYLELLKKEARERGNGARSSSLEGDFVELAPTLEKRDIVTLDRVLCCYPHLDALLRAAASCSKGSIGLVYPREGPLMRIGFKVADFGLRLWGKEFQLYLHPRERVLKALEEEGFVLQQEASTFLWKVELFERADRSL